MGKYGILEDFVRDQNINLLDPQKVYDAGIAFKEMSLYESAIQLFIKSSEHEDWTGRSAHMVALCLVEIDAGEVEEDDLIRAVGLIDEVLTDDNAGLKGKDIDEIQEIRSIIADNLF